MNVLRKESEATHIIENDNVYLSVIKGTKYFQAQGSVSST